MLSVEFFLLSPLQNNHYKIPQKRNLELFVLRFIYLFVRVSQHTEQEGRGKENPKQTLLSMEPNSGLSLMTLRS